MRSRGLMETMVSHSQPSSTELAVALARDHYGLSVQATRLTGERDENFRLSATDGTEYVLKIAHEAEAPSVTELLAAVLVYLEQADPTLPCPRVLRARTGATQVHFTDANGRARTARLLTYLPGKLLGCSTRSRQQRRSCGRMAGRLTRALRGFEHSAAHRDLIWDLRQTVHLRELLDELSDFPHRRLASVLLDDIVPRIEADLPRMRHQVVHNDFNPLNVLVDPADETRLVGIIDFGDLTHTAVIADVAVTAAEQIPADCGHDTAQARAAVLDIAGAYHESLPLQAGELDMLGTLTAARLVANLIVHEWHVYRNPTSGHFAALKPDFIEARLAVARQLSREDFKL
jgi:hydroxylysine kinase